MFRSLIPKYVAKRDFRSASAVAGFLFNVQLQTGRYEEALKLVEEKTGLYPPGRSGTLDSTIR